MAQFTLYHGNKNYSSWSMRGWLSLRLSGVDFDEVAFNLGEEGVREKILEYSPTAKVPALRHGDLVIWDSLSIAEYLAERVPELPMWPADANRRAVARSVVAEMHSGFPALRANMPFNVRRASPGIGRAAGVEKDIERVQQIWRDCRAAHGSEGSFLFSRWCLADVFFAPVVSRFHTYAVDVDDVCRAYCKAVREQTDVREWRAAAEAEPWIEAEYDL